MVNSALVRGVAGVAALVLGASLATTADAAPKPPKSKPQYVALGDSYASGNGAGSYLSDGTDCHRSLLGYPGRIAASGNYALNLQACSGALTSDVETLQLTTLNSGTAFVTVTVGGNDIGFANVITTCLGTNTTACLAAIDTATGQATSQLPAKLGALFTQVKAKAPNAKIVATNYPRLFNGSDCSLLTSFTAQEMAGLNAGADTLSGVIADAAAVSGIRYADVRPPFVGHAVCDGTAWIRNASVLKQYESFHPNSSGYQYGYTPVVTTVLGGTTSTTGGAATVTTGGQTSTDTRRGEVRVKAGQN